MGKTDRHEKAACDTSYMPWWLVGVKGKFPRCHSGLLGSPHPANMTFEPRSPTLSLSWSVLNYLKTPFLALLCGALHNMLGPCPHSAPKKGKSCGPCCWAAVRFAKGWTRGQLWSLQAVTLTTAALTQLQDSIIMV